MNLLLSRMYENLCQIKKIVFTCTWFPEFMLYCIWCSNLRLYLIVIPAYLYMYIQTIISMNGRRRGRDHRRGPMQFQEQGGDRKSISNQNQGSETGVGDQMAMAINHIADLLVQLVDRQGQNPINQSRNPKNPEGGEDRAFKCFQKFSSSKFFGGPDPKIAENWLTKMIDISRF